MWQNFNYQYVKKWHEAELACRQDKTNWGKPARMARIENERQQVLQQHYLPKLISILRGMEDHSGVDAGSLGQSPPGSGKGHAVPIFSRRKGRAEKG